MNQFQASRWDTLEGGIQAPGAVGPWFSFGGPDGGGGYWMHRCDMCGGFLKTRSKALVYLVVQSSTRAIYFLKKDDGP